MISNQADMTQGSNPPVMDQVVQESMDSTNLHTGKTTPVTAQVETPSHQVEMPSAKTQVNPSLARLLIGGLIGATVGAIAGALSNRKTSQGFNHAVQGVNRASKTIGEGLSHAASGVMDATKSVGEGMNYAITESTHDATQGIAEGTQQVKTIATEVAETTTNQMNRTAQGIAEGAQQAKAATLKAMQTTKDRVSNTVQETVETVKSTAQDAGDSVKAAIAPPDSEAAMPASSDFGTELMQALQEDENIVSPDDGLEIALINALQDEDTVACSTTFFIPTEGMVQDDEEAAEAALQEYLFADVEVNRPGE